MVKFFAAVGRGVNDDGFVVVGEHESLYMCRNPHQSPIPNTNTSQLVLDISYRFSHCGQVSTTSV